MSSFVLGFAEEGAQVAGLAWSLAGRKGALVAIAGVLSDPGADASIDGGTVRVEAAVDGRKVTVEATVSSEKELFADPLPAGSPSASLVDAEVRLTGPDTSASAPSVLTTWADDPAEGAGLVRHLSLPVADGGAIVLVAARPADAPHHSDESVAAWKLDRSDSPVPFSEALLSTQYDEAGLPTRTGLELWPEDPDTQATRAAGSNLLARQDDGAIAALMHSAVDGSSGVGGYLIVRP